MTFNTQHSTIKRFCVKDCIQVTRDGVEHLMVSREKNFERIIQEFFLATIQDRGKVLMDNQAVKQNIHEAALFLLGKKEDGSKEYKSGMMLMGTPGTGKTTLMSAMSKATRFLYDKDIVKCDYDRCITFFIKASDLSAWQRDNKEHIARIKSCDILFIDDLGFSGEREMVNDYGNKTMPICDVLDYRYDRNMVTVVTTNLGNDEIRERYGERIYSRLCEQFKGLRFVGTDYRTIKQ